MNDIKQVIVLRADLNMRKGKMVAQGSHASLLWLIDRIGHIDDELGISGNIVFSSDEVAWLNKTAMKKICVRVNSEHELDELHNAAVNAGLLSHMVIDNGLTEFHGVLTKTALAIGPGVAAQIDVITGKLDLL